MSLRTDVYKLLDNTYRLCSEVTEASSISRQLLELRGRLNKPLRVAIVGQRKAGKSTFMNALMQAAIVYTGVQETTFTVCWFRYGKQPALTVRFRNGEEEEADFADMEKWSVRSYAAENPRIMDVEYLIVSYPSEVLKQIEFIDTPGLNSVYGADSKNTLDFLSMRGEQDTLKEAGKADAVIFAFQSTFTEVDKKALRNFHGKANGNTSPINSIGIFTRLDEGGCGWDVRKSACDPVASARPYIQRHMEDPLVKSLLFTILPVCAKPAEGYMQLEEQDWAALKQLSKVDPKRLRMALSNASNFSTRSDNLYDENIYGGVEARKRLIDRIGAYGIREITEQLYAGKTKGQIEETLQELCGIDAVRNLISSHFGNRIFLIKTQYIFNQLSQIENTIRFNPDSKAELTNIARYIKEETDRLRGSAQNLKELQILQLYYGGELDCFSDEESEDLLRVTGEYGRLPEVRLNVPEGSGILEMMHTAKNKASNWNAKAASYWKANTYTTAASVIARSYELMYYHLSALVDE